MEMHVQLPYRNRRAAGYILARCLNQYKYRDRPDVVAFGLFRGGVPVAYEIALALNVPLAVCLVRKLCMPECPELAVGAVASGGVCVLNPAIGSVLTPQIALLRKTAEQELKQCEKQYQILPSPPMFSIPPLRGKTAILADDGLATGTTMHAAVRVIRHHYEASYCVVATPVASLEACSSFRNEADKIICPATPCPFYNVSQFYEDFTQITDEETQDLLALAAQRGSCERAKI
jgi:putative phosphoribosyl transferase